MRPLFFDAEPSEDTTTSLAELPLLEVGRWKARVVGERPGGTTFPRVLSSPLAVRARHV